MISMIVAIALTGCATQYAYNFQLANPSADDPALEARVEVRDADGAIALSLRNKTDQVLQVQWDKIVVDRGDGTTTALRPTTDLGWIQPGATVAAQLVPFALPRSGSAAARYQGRRVELDVPVIAMFEPKTYRFQFVAHVQPL